MNQPKKPGNRFEELQSSGTVTPNSVSLNGNTPRSVSPVTVPVTVDSNLLNTFDDDLNEMKGRISAGIPGIDFVSTVDTYEKSLIFALTLNDKALQKSMLKPFKFRLIKVLAADKEKSSKETSTPEEPAPPARAAPEPFLPTDEKTFPSNSNQIASNQSLVDPSFTRVENNTEVYVDYKDVYGLLEEEVKPRQKNPISKQSSSAGQCTGRPISPLTNNPLANRNKRDNPSGSVSTNKAPTPVPGETPAVSVPVSTTHMPAHMPTPSTIRAPAAAPAKPAPTTSRLDNNDVSSIIILHQGQQQCALLASIASHHALKTATHGPAPSPEISSSPKTNRVLKSLEPHQTSKVTSTVTSAAIDADVGLVSYKRFIVVVSSSRIWDPGGSAHRSRVLTCTLRTQITHHMAGSSVIYDNMRRQSINNTHSWSDSLQSRVR